MAKKKESMEKFLDDAFSSLNYMKNAKGVTDEAKKHD